MHLEDAAHPEFALQSVTSIDPDARTVTIDKAGYEPIKYDHLVVATGGQPKKLPIEGADLENVCLLRTIEDAQKIVAGKS